jgi:hypothetical protein
MPVRLHLGLVVGQLDSARLAAAADLYLCLHHHRVTDSLGDCNGLVHRVRDITGRNRDTKLREVLLALIFEQVH